MSSQLYNPFRHIVRKGSSQPDTKGDLSQSRYVDVIQSYTGTEAPDSDNTGKPKRSIILNPRPRRPFRNPGNEFYLPLVGIAYLIHLRCRHYRPRRLLPPLTSLRITEIYVLAAISVPVLTEGAIFWLQAYKNRDLCTIQTLAVALHSHCAPFLRKAREELTEESARKYSELRSEFTNYPKEGGLAQKLAWWYHHTWSDPVAWNLMFQDQYVTMQKHKLESALSQRDWDILVTHLANSFQGSDGKLCLLDPWRVCCACLAFTPFAIGARIFCVPRIFVAMNIVQRLLIYSSLFLFEIRYYHHYRYPTMLHDIHSAAVILTKTAPELPRLVDKVMSSGWAGPYVL